MRDNRVVSDTCKRRFAVQGITGYSSNELYQFRWGLRMAYYACDALVIIGLLSANLYILGAALIMAFLGIFLPYHPVDYLYNGVVRHFLNGPKVPRRTNQVRFACILATLMLVSTIWLFSAGLGTLALVVGFTMVFVATLVATTDICIPSMIYNWMFRTGPGRHS